MARFMTRVELHAAYTSKDYDNLHEAMRKAGFARKILADSGVWYHLPTAEYNIEGPYTAQSVLTSAKVAANSTGKYNAVLVSEYTQATWDGLPKVE